jgi:hypothetical protein
MSRGPGKRQRAILDLLTRAAERAERCKRGELPADPLRAMLNPRRLRSVDGRRISDDDGCMRVELSGEERDEADLTPLTRAQREANRRALRSLEARGLIEVELMPRRSAAVMGMPAIPAQLVARLSVAPGQGEDNA